MALIQALNAQDSILRQTGLVSRRPANPLCIIAFGNEKEYLTYEPKPGSAGFYQPGRNVDYIVLKSLDPKKTRVALHEYAHYLVKNSFPSLPLWLKEGAADVFSSTDWNGQEFKLGAPLPERVWALKNLSPISLETLFTVQFDSPVYSNSNEGCSFYAQSWALAHMLMLGATYSSHFPEFLTEVSSGRSTADAFRIVYGKDLQAVKKDLDLYWAQKTQRHFASGMGSGVSAAPELTNPSQIDVELALADVLASDPYRQTDAETRLTELSARYPDNASVEESLAYLQMQQHRVADAQTHILRAIGRGSLNGDLICRYVASRSQAPGGAEESIPLLQRVLSVQPKNGQVRMMLANNAVKLQNFELAVSTLQQIETVRPQDAFRFFYLLAYCKVRLKDLRGGEAFGVQAKRYAATAQEQTQTDKLLRYVETSQANGSAVHPLGSAD